MQYGSTHYVIGSRTAPNVYPRDIARALSRINRFTGHSVHPLSVARHSVFVSNILMDQGFGAKTQLYGLVHDIHETVANDLSWAVKQALPPAARQAYDAICENADEALYGALGVSWPMPLTIQAAVKIADWIAVATEKRDLMPSGDKPWDMMPWGPSPRQALSTSDPNEDMADWLFRFSELKTALAIEDFRPSQEIYAV